MGFHLQRFTSHLNRATNILYFKKENKLNWINVSVFNFSVIAKSGRSTLIIIIWRQTAIENHSWGVYIPVFWMIFNGSKFSWKMHIFDSTRLIDKFKYPDLTAVLISLQSYSRLFSLLRSLVQSNLCSKNTVIIFAYQRSISSRLNLMQVRQPWREFHFQYLKTKYLRCCMFVAAALLVYVLSSLALYLCM